MSSGTWHSSQTLVYIMLLILVLFLAQNVVNIKMWGFFLWFLVAQCVGFTVLLLIVWHYFVSRVLGIHHASGCDAWRQWGLHWRRGYCLRKLRSKQPPMLGPFHISYQSTFWYVSCFKILSLYFLLRNISFLFHFSVIVNLMIIHQSH